LETHFSDKIKDFYAYAEILQAMQVDLPVLLNAFRGYFEKENCFLLAAFDYSAIVLKDNIVFYKNFQSSKIIFCEGAKATANPFFSYLPFNIDKGELLIIKIPDAHFNKVIKNNISIIPLKNRGENIYWVGATNEWHSPHDKPTEEKKQELIEELKHILRVDFEVIEHHAAYRPTVKDRRPFIGFHPEKTQLAIFNGFGTKGASLIPYWANHFTEVLVSSKTLDNDVNIARFR
jgi:glycine/D-amino acid oxidase-like deaminating enzyme